MERRPLVFINGRLQELPLGDTLPTEETMLYTKRLDTISDSLMYKGEAAAGSLESAAVWRISRISIINDDINEVWADGNTNFDNVWVDRLSISYT
jgi:hypothetical protein